MKCLFAFWCSMMMTFDVTAMEFSGVCRAGDGATYYTISDRDENEQRGRDGFVQRITIDKSGIEFVQMHGVLSPGGGIWPNNDWEDIHCEAGKVYILDNMKNMASGKRILECDEPPAEHGSNLIVRRVYAFYHEGSVEGLTRRGSRLYVADAALHHPDGLDSMFRFLEPVQLYSFEIPREQPSVISEVELTPVGLSNHINGHCSALDYCGGRFIVHCRATTYVTDDNFKIKKKQTGMYGQSEGACFLHGGKRVVRQNEAGDYQIWGVR